MGRGLTWRWRGRAGTRLVFCRRRGGAPRPWYVEAASPRMRNDESWQPFRGFPERGPAEALSVQLESAGVPTKIEATALRNGIDAHYWVHVAKSLAHRARCVTTQLPPTDAELDFLATGKLPGQE